MDTTKSEQPPYNGQTICPPPYISTSKEGTTSKQNAFSPMCPLFRGSTVYFFILVGEFGGSLGMFGEKISARACSGKEIAG